MDQTNQTKPTNYYQMHYTGNSGELFGIVLKNFFLSLITFGIYSPWARTEKRKYIWRHTDFNQHPFSYHGTGLELFFGMLKVLLVFGLYEIISQVVAAKGGHIAAVIVAVASILIVAVIIPFLNLAAHRYRMNRTSYRGIRFGVDRIDGQYFKMSFIGIILTIFTLGIYYPFLRYHLHRLRMNATRYGSDHFSYHGTASDEFGITIKGFLLSIVTLGIYRFWYRAELYRYRMSRTNFSGVKMTSRINGGDFLALWIMQLITMLTFGLFYSVMVTSWLETVFRCLDIEGTISFDEIVARNEATASALPEAADSFFDLGDFDVSVGLGL